MNIFNREKSDKKFDRELFAIHDSKTGIYRPPMIHVNQYELMREIENLFRDPEHAKVQIVVNAEDFSIFKVGDYDTSTGEIRPAHAHVANLIDIRSSMQRGNADRMQQV